MAGLLIPKHGSGLRRLLAAHAMAGQQLVELTATGNPAAFTATASKPLIQCKVSFSPVQSGSGDPSPENIRPITRWTGVNVYHSGSDTSDPTTYPVTWTEQGMVYGGYVDLATGLLVSEYGIKVFTGTEVNSWAVFSGSVYTSNNVLPGIKSASDHLIYGYSSMCIATNDGSLNSLYIKQAYADHGVQFYQLSSFWGVSDVTSAAWNSKLAEWYANDTPLTVVYKLGTPIEHTLTPQQITALAGANNIWSDANGDLTIKYLSKGE